MLQFFAARQSIIGSMVTVYRSISAILVALVSFVAAHNDGSHSSALDGLISGLHFCSPCQTPQQPNGNANICYTCRHPGSLWKDQLTGQKIITDLVTDYGLSVQDLKVLEDSAQVCSCGRATPRKNTERRSADIR